MSEIRSWNSLVVVNLVVCLSIAAKKLNVKTVIYCDDGDAPAQNFVQ